MTKINMRTSWTLPALATLLSGCGATQYEIDTSRHITTETISQEEAAAAPSGVPDLVGSTAELPELVYEGSEEIFDVVVENINVRDLLLSLADQAQLNMDVDTDVEGIVSLNAYGQTLDQVMERIRQQLPLRYERVGDAVVVMNDELYYRQYYMHFPNLSRSYEASASGETVSSGAGSLGSSEIESEKLGSGSVWEDLVEAINQILVGGFYEVDRAGDRGPLGTDPVSASLAEAATDFNERAPQRVEHEPFVHSLPDAGLLIVYGSAEQHALISDVIEKVSSSSRRQVLLQATVVEIQLNNTYQQGIDWSIFKAASEGPRFIQSAALDSGRALFGAGSEAALEQIEALVELKDAITEAGGDNPDTTAIDSLIQSSISDLVNAQPSIPSGSASGGFLNSTFTIGNMDVAISLLDRFGDTKVVSSPRISTLNGQAAILKVVEDAKYFTVNTTTVREGSNVTQEVSIEETTVPIGFVVNVYPQVGEDGTIILSMRPSISRVVGYAQQPSTSGNESSGVPIVSVKEIETLMLLRDGQTAVMGGLIEDQNLDSSTGVPGLNRVPGLGGFFENKSEQTRRVEYVIFVSARIIRNPSLHGDFREYQDWLPSDETFHRDQTGTFFGNEVSKVSRGK